MESKYPDHFVCLQQINKNQWSIVFRRNNLSKQQFNFDTENNYYWYEETFNNTNSQVSFRVTIKSSIFYDIFCAKCKHFGATGGNNSFGIIIQSNPFNIGDVMYKVVSKKVKEDSEFVKYRCSFKGTFHIYQLFGVKWNKLDKTAIYNKYRNYNMRSKSKPKHQNQTIKEIPYEKVKKIKISVDFDIVKNCRYFKNKMCTYINDICNPNSIRCKNPDISLHKDIHLSHKANHSQPHKNKLEIPLSETHQYVKAVVLSHNRKCVYEDHHLTPVKAIIKVLKTNNNEVIEVIIPAAYCKECNQYIILKTDFNIIKQKGILLCRVIDETSEYIAKHKNSSYSGTESKVHRLGYNVIKQGYNYTFAQRKIILANIIENYEITQHEILSMLDTNIARKIGLPNYADAVEKWKQDREFVANYKTGDMPEIIIEEVVIGKREQKSNK